MLIYECYVKVLGDHNYGYYYANSQKQTLCYYYVPDICLTCKHNGNTKYTNTAIT